MNDDFYMKLAIKESEKCPKSFNAFAVGCVIVHGKETTLGYSRKISNCHAEEYCIMNCHKTEGSTLYSTMEPCGERLSGANCCADLIIKAGIKRVVYCIKEPKTFIEKTIGLQKLREAGIIVECLSGFDKECYQVNSHLF
jgi:diaminohydroxyphosphoribosylaminopyrimidine deaminase/5-amino-6-(5-phosphoribosylamino)uracil reductase